MQYNDIKPCNWYIKQDHSYCDFVNEHQICLHVKYILYKQNKIATLSPKDKAPLWDFILK